MFSFPPPSLTANDNGSNMPDNLAPPADLAFTTTLSVVRVPIVTAALTYPLERPAKTMKVDDQGVESSADGVALGKVAATAVGLDASKISYACIVSKDGTQVAVDTIPSLDDVVVADSDVRVDKSGTFPSVEFSERVHDCIDYSMHRSLIVRLLG
ncbi:hypothetical protein V6N12_057342 [Hibiscus sabdariffa]|uniref:Uncharacterized protein n=1 Tax=Hibiscus sabdariffa TaxID=183260 RepID=A0ABR2DBN2_9ROSI